MKTRSTKPFLILIILLLLSGLFVTMQAGPAFAEKPLLVLSNDPFTALEPGGPRTFDRILVAQNPAWADFRQEIEEQGLWTGGQIFSSFAWGYELGTGVNPAVILVTYGVAYDWALPPDGDLAFQVEQIRAQLDMFWSEWVHSQPIQTQHPIANGATYALYRYFDGDLQKLGEWAATFEAVFAVSPTQPLAGSLLVADIDNIAPFLQRPFDQLYGTNRFYHVTSFFDHHYPLYSDEPEDRTDLYRFDGIFFPNIPEPDECGMNGDTGSGTYCYSGHPAYDYPVVEGAPVKAAADGRLVFCEPRWGALFIRHQNGLITSYLHMNPLEIPDGIACADVAEEQPEVMQGQVIGYVSNIAPRQMAVHLHFGVGYEASIRERQNVDPFGWWWSEPDPWEEYQGPEYNGLPSKWLWHGDERGDGLLTVDNSETQAQLFNAPYASGDWDWVENGYPAPDGDAWYAHLSYITNITSTAIYWGIWGVNIEQPGVYQVQAYWPPDPDPQADPEPARKVVYTLHYHDPQGQVRSMRLYADQSRDANQFVTLCAVPYEDNPEGCPEYPEIYLGSGPSVIILRDVSEEPVEPGKYMVFFDAVRWQAVVPPTPTPTLTPSPTTTPTFTSTSTSTSTPTSTPTATPTSTPTPTTGTPSSSPTPPPDLPPGPGEHLAQCDFSLSVSQGNDALHWCGPASTTNRAAFLSWSGTYDRPKAFAGAVFRVLRSGPDVGVFNAYDLAYEKYDPGPDGRSGTWGETVEIHDAVWGMGAEGDNVPGPLIWLVSRCSGNVCGSAQVSGVLYYIAPGTPTPTPTFSPTPTPPCALQWMQGQVSGLQDLRLFYQVRSRLTQTPTGQRYVEIYYRYSPSLIQLMQQDPEVRQAFGEGLWLWKSMLQAWGEGRDAIITHEQVAALQRFLKLVAERGEPSLRAAVMQEMQRLPWEQMAGMRLSALEQMFLGSSTAHQGIPVPTGRPQP